MKAAVAIIGAGVSGLTCAVCLAEAGYRTRIFADEVGQSTTSAVAGAIWFPYDVEPIDAATAWSLEGYGVFRELSSIEGSGVSMIELRTFSRVVEIAIPSWAFSLGARSVDPVAVPDCFVSGYALEVPLVETGPYLDYLLARYREAGGQLETNVRLARLEEITAEFKLLVNCAGLGAKTLVPDSTLEAHRGQVAIVSKLALDHAVVCDDPPLMYAIPRRGDCVFGGSNEISEDLQPDAALGQQIIGECCRVLGIPAPKKLRERVGLRPFRPSGICLRRDQLGDSRPVIHNYGHGGAGFTLSWGCAREVLALSEGQG